MRTFSALFRRECTRGTSAGDNVRTCILCLSCNVKKPITTTMLSKKSIVFDEVRAYVTVSYYTVAQHESGILVSDRIYTKNLSCQCNFTAQIEAVQDKINLLRTGHHDFLRGL